MEAPPTTPPAGPLQPNRPDDADRILREAFAPRRPDAEAFRRGVDQRLRERERQLAEDEARAAAVPEGLRWAAGVLPPGLVPAAMGTASLFGKKVGVKALPGAFALPAMALLMTLGAFLIGLRVLFGKREVTESFDSSHEAVVDWWRRNKVAALVSLALILLLGVSGHSETAGAILLASMVVAVLLVGQLGKAGFADPHSVGLTLGRLLWGLTFYGFMLRDLVHAGPSPRMRWLAVALLGLGATVCVVLSGVLTWERTKARLWEPERMRYPDPITLWCLRLMVWPLVGCVLVAGAVFFAFSVRLAWPVKVGRSDLVRTFEEAHPSEMEFRHSSELEVLERVLFLLESDGGPPPQVAALREAFAPELASESRGASFATRRLGLASDGGELSARAALALVRLKGEDGRSDPGLHSTLQELGGWLSTQALPEADARLFVDRALELAWPAEDDLTQLQPLYHLTRFARELGQVDRLLAHRPAAHRILERHWAAGEDRGVASGFLAYRHKPLSGWLAPIAATRRTDPEATQTAVELMNTFGCPKGIDSNRLRAYLEGELALPHFPIGDPLHRRMVHELALYQLDHIDPDLRPTLAERLVEARLPLGAFLLAALCILAVVRTRRPQA